MREHPPCHTMFRWMPLSLREVINMFVTIRVIQGAISASSWIIVSQESSFFCHLWNIPRHVPVSSRTSSIKWFSSTAEQWISWTLFYFSLSVLLVILQWPLESWLGSGCRCSTGRKPLSSPKQSTKGQRHESQFTCEDRGREGGKSSKSYRAFFPSFFSYLSVRKEISIRHWEQMSGGWDKWPCEPPVGMRLISL